MVSPGRCQSRVPHNGPARNFISPTSSNVQQSLAGLRDFCETVCYVLLSMTKTNLLDDIVVEDVLSDVDDISQHSVIRTRLQVVNVGPKVVRVCQHYTLEIFNCFPTHLGEELLDKVDAGARLLQGDGLCCS